MDVSNALETLERFAQSDSHAMECVHTLRQALHHGSQERQDAARYRALLVKSVQIAAGSSLDPVAGDLLDALMSVVDAPRGFFGVADGQGSWSIVAARNLDSSAECSQFSTGIIDRALASCSPVVEVDAQEGEFQAQRSVSNLALRSVACFPVGRSGATGFVYVDNPVTRGFFDKAAVDAVTAWLPLFDDWVARVISESRGGSPALPGVLTRSPVLLERLAELARVARFDVPVLLWGETGTGKSLIARRLHEASPRRGPFVHVNCAALPADLVEAELFGAEAGAYTGATRLREGRFEAANGGTLFLDELDLLPNELQAKLLVAVQEKRVTRLGSNRPIDLDVRIVSAMSSPPADSIAAGRLREELYFRLAVIETSIPPLRDRPEDVPLLARFALEQARARFDLRPLRLAPEALDKLLHHSWPGNVRELENSLDRAALLSDEGLIRHLDLRTTIGLARSKESTAAAALSSNAAALSSNVQGFARRRYGIKSSEFEKVWEQECGVVNRVADSLGVTRRTVYRLKQKYIDDAATGPSPE